MVASFRKFHEEPLYVFGSFDMEQATDAGFPLGANYAYFGSLLADRYKTVVHLDADCLITGRLDEFIEADYDIAGCLNFGNLYIDSNNLNNEKIVGEILYKDYITAGIFAINSRDAWDEYYRRCMFEVNEYKFVEQDILNLIFYSGTYKTKLIDGPNSNVYYGTLVRERWNELSIENNQVMLNGRQVKIIHWAGGENLEKLNYRKDGFPEEVCTYLDTLI